MSTINNSDYLDRLSIPRSKTGRMEKRKKNVLDELNLHPSIHNFHTIKWLRRRLGKERIIKSIYKLLPNDGIVNETEGNKLLLYMENYNKELEKIKNSKTANVNSFTLNPNYIFSAETVKKIITLKNIFVEFDEDGSRKLELDEMVEMFNTNNILTDMTQLCSLFFPDKNPKKEQMESLFLDFYQFMEFALSHKSDQSFRNFMRNFKNINNNLNIFSNNAIEATTKRISTLNNNIEMNNLRSHTHKDHKDSQFLPMNFNLLLDFFNKKSNVRNLNRQIDIICVSKT